MVLLGTVHWKVLLGTKNCCSMESLQKHPFGTFIFKSVEILIVNNILCFYAHMLLLNKSACII